MVMEGCNFEMIKNIILDIGNVLAAFCWPRHFKALGFRGEILERVADATIRSSWWKEYDKSVLSNEEIIQGCIDLAPDLEAQIRLVFDQIEGLCETYDYAADWIYSMKSAGYRVYILSNFGKLGYERVRASFDFLDYADGAVISYEIGEAKPDQAIFTELERRYQINPEESVFIDDMPVNVRAAKRFGYKGIIFENRALAERKLAGLGVLFTPQSISQDRFFMKEALRQAKKAAKLSEVPIGCVIVHEGQIIARGYNQRNTKHSTLAHGEIRAIEKASKVLDDWRLSGCTIYITLEPCPMCAGAIVQARIDRAVIGTMNAKAGCAGSVQNLLKEPGFNHQVDVTYGVLQQECTELLQSFFGRLRDGEK